MVQNGMIDGKSMNYAGNHGKFAGEGCDVNWGWWDFLGLHGMLPCSVTFFFFKLCLTVLDTNIKTKTKGKIILTQG